MTQYSKTTLATFFETGDVPQGADYANLIDSQINAVETTAQSMAGPLITTELITPRVSAATINITGKLSAAGIVTTVVSANSIYSDSAVVSQTVQAATIQGTTVSAGTAYADQVSVSGAIITGSLRVRNGTVSAAGTTQGTAAVLTNIINQGRGIVDGVSTGFVPPANQPDSIRYLYNNGASANLWPPVGGTINGLAVNAAFPVPASSMITIIHLTASAMAAK